MERKHGVAATLVLLSSIAGAEEAVTIVPWQDTIRQAALVKEGLGRLYNPHYQFECIGLGGTTMRVGPNGFTKPGAPARFARWLFEARAVPGL